MHFEALRVVDSYFSILENLACDSEMAVFSHFAFFENSRFVICLVWSTFLMVFGALEKGPLRPNRRESMVRIFEKSFQTQGKRSVFSDWQFLDFEASFRFR